MDLKAKLVSGWKDYAIEVSSTPANRKLEEIQSELLSSHLHKLAREQAKLNHSYPYHLQMALMGSKSARASAQVDVIALDRLFRKNVEGFKPIKQFVSGLLFPANIFDRSHTIICEIDVFAFAFLKEAKNFDVLLDCTENNQEFLNTREEWFKSLEAIEQFELFGTLPISVDRVDLECYLKLRTIVIRPSARDERRVLASLLVSGPSTLSQISDDLGLAYTLGPRTLFGLLDSGTVVRCRDRYATESSEEATFKIDEAALPIAIYCVRETVGLDPLAAFDDVLPRRG